MKITALAAAALLALTLAGCSTGASTDTGSTDDTSTDSGDSDTSTDDGGSGDLITLSGSGDYTVGVTAPIGGYSLEGNPDEQPDGCTWALEDADGKVQFENQGNTVFITDVNEFFQTSGCPDWVQFE